MPEPTIVRGSDHFFNVTYEGNGTGQRVGNFIPYTDNGTIAKSCMFNDDDNPYLTKTAGASPSSTKIFTLSWWVKRSALSATQTMIGLAEVSGSTNRPVMNFDSSNRLQVVTSGGTTMNKVTTRTFEDTSKWYHIVVRIDTTQSTAADRVRIYVDGDQITVFTTNTIPSQNADFQLASQTMNIGRLSGTSQKFDGYLAEIHYADGQSYGPDTFGITDTSTGRWIPKSLGSITYGNNGYRMEFANSAGQTIGDDTSGNANDFTVNNLGANDIMVDSPTQNFTNMTGDNTGGFTIAEGGLNITSPGSGQYEQIVGLPSFGVATGKWYWEVRVYNKGQTQLGWKSDDHVGGAGAADTSVSPHTGSGAIGIGYNVGGSGGFADGEWTDDYSNAYSDFSTFTAASAGDIVMFALDLDNNKGYVGLNGTWFNSANPANGTGSIGLSTPATGKNKFYPMMLRLDGAGQNNFNFGQNRTFSNAFDKSAVANTASSGPGFFKYTPPTDFLAICQDNLSTTEKGIPGLTWIKDRDNTYSHGLRDSNRGPNKDLFTNLDQAEVTNTDGVQKFLKGGFSIEDLLGLNADGASIVSWNWVGNGGTTSANADGSGASLASTIQANQTAGFSIVTYAGSSSGSQTVAHGLSEAPEWIAIKNRTDSSRSWFIYVPVTKYDTTPQNRYFRFNSDDSHASGNVFNNTAPTNKVFSIQDAGSLNTNGSGKNYIAYCWHSVEGYSKIGDWYEGNGSTNGPFIYTGFKPAWLLIKGINIGNSWQILDNARDPINPVNKVLEPDSTAADATGHNIDFLANGFKIRTSDADINGSYAYWYAAFAEHPFVGDGTNPCPAR